jgi:hypothetical protein
VVVLSIGILYWEINIITNCSAFEVSAGEKGKRVIDVALRRPETMKSAARKVPQPFQVAAKSKWVLFEAPATWKGCGTFSEENAEHTEITEQTEVIE